MTETAWAYLAVSSDAQAETLPEQRAWADETAALNGWRIERYFQAVGSGKQGVRRLMQILLAELEETPAKQRPRRVLMVRVDRTGRGNAIDVIAAIAQIRKLGVTIHTRVDGDLRLERAADSLKTIFDAIQGGLENEARSDRSRAGHLKRKREGKHAGHAPYGTVLIDGVPAVDEVRAFVVREMFRLRLEGWGTQRLARHLSAIAPPKRRVDGSSRPIRWGENTVGRMLQCQTYRGLLVDEQTFDAAQRVSNSPIGRTPKYEWPLRGAVRCTCGHMLSTSYSGPKRYRSRYYTCRNVTVHRDRYPYHRADALEAQFLRLLEQVARDPSFCEPADAGPDTTDLERTIDMLNAKISDLDTRRRRAWEIAEAGGISPEDLRARIAELMDQRTALDEQLHEALSAVSSATALQRSREAVAETLGDLAASWPLVDVQTRREIAKAVAGYLGGLYVEPSPPRGAARSVLRAGQSL